MKRGHAIFKIHSQPQTHAQKKANIRLDFFAIEVSAVPASCGGESIEVEAGGEANSSAGEQGRHSSSPLQRSTEAPSVGSDKKSWPNAFTTRNTPISVGHIISLEPTLIPLNEISLIIVFSVANSTCLAQY